MPKKNAALPKMYPYNAKLILLWELRHLLSLLQRYRIVQAKKQDPAEKDAARLVVDGLVQMVGVLENYLDLHLGDVQRPAQKLPGKYKGKNRLAHFKLALRKPGPLPRQVKERIPGLAVEEQG